MSGFFSRLFGRNKSIAETRPWLKQYAEGVPADIDPDAYGSAVEILNEAMARYGDKTAFICAGQELTYQDLDAQGTAFAAYLSTVAKLKKGDRVAIMTPNLLAFPIASVGILRAGLVQVNVNPLYTPRELAHQLSDSGAETIVIFDAVLETLKAALDKTSVKHVIVVKLNPFDAGDVEDGVVPGATSIGFGAALEVGASKKFSPPKITGKDLIFIQYTGGTTGVSKGAALSHRNIVANVQQTKAFLQRGLKDGEEVIFTAIPLYHIFALAVNFLIFFSLGARNVLIPNPRNIDVFVGELKRYPPTAFIGVNTLFNGLLSAPGIEEVDFSGFKFSLGGGAAIQKAVSDRWKKLTGVFITEGYGLSETSPVVSVNPLWRYQYREGIGIPLPSTLVSIRDENNREVPQGEDGELCVKGPQVMQGYWQRQDETDQVMTSDGYFKTGDIARMEADGQFVISDRKKDMILVSGFNVYPNEV